MIEVFQGDNHKKIITKFDIKCKKKSQKSEKILRISKKGYFQRKILDELGVEFNKIGPMNKKYMFRFFA
ncbi:hypothetical protein R9X47_26295 [Wukongibacter baidiensis]|uniref:hypothetical protein n=1 Tax=Wukongibacter baidiensis TaxID=1723361 RepID=UPI003D7FD33B